MTEKKPLTADERKDIKEITALCKILGAGERKVILNIGNDLVMIRRMGLEVYECKSAANN